MKPRQFILAFLAFCQVFCLKAQSPFDGCEWISIPENEQQPNQWLCFRKNISLGKTEKDAKLFVAVDSKYWLWINGKTVVREGGLKRGPNPEDTYYDEIDVGHWLHKGKNQVLMFHLY